MTNKSKYTKVNGEGGNNDLTSTKATKTLGFKPFIATSLALALGVSVAVATDPTITVDNVEQNISQPWVGNSESNLGNFTWQAQSNGLMALTSAQVGTANSSNPIVKNWEVKFDATQTTHPTVWTGSNGTFTYYVQAASNSTPVYSFNSNGNGIQLSSDGDGTLKLQFKASENGTTTDTFADLTFANNTGDTALQGNIIIVGGFSNVVTQNPNFTPKDQYRLSFTGNVEGNINQSLYLDFPNNTNSNTNIGWTPFGEMIFTDKDNTHNSNINGNLNITIGGVKLEMGKGRITGRCNSLFPRCQCYDLC